MQKTQFSSVLLRRRHPSLHSSGLERQLVPVRHFHVTPTSVADQHPPGFPDETPSSQRRQNTTEEIKRVFDHGTRFHDISQRKGGVPVEEERTSSRNNHGDHQRPSPSNGDQTARNGPPRAGAVDARNLAAQSNSVPKPPQGDYSKPLVAAAIDARSLGARPGPQPSQRDRRPPLPGGPIDARNLAAHIPPKSDSQSGDPPRNLIRRVGHDDDPLRPIIPRGRNFAKAGPPRREARDSINAASQKPLREPGPRKRLKREVKEGGGVSKISISYGDDGIEYSGDKLGSGIREFLDEVREHKRPKAVAYLPAEVTAQTLSGNGPAIPLGGWGMNEIVEEWVSRIGKEGERRREDLALMAEKWTNGNTVDFGGDQERKKQMLDAAENGMQDMSEEEQGVVAEKLRETFGKVFAERVFKGEYVFEGRKEGGVLDSLARQTTRNASFLPRDGESLAAKVRSLLPAEISGGAQKAPRA